MDVTQLKTLQDWVVERKLRIVPGVADVLVLGGKTKEYQAEIDLNKMVAHGLSLPQIISAISRATPMSAAAPCRSASSRLTCAVSASLGSMEDIGNIVLTQQGGVPILLSDIAKIQIGFTPRLGMAGRDDTTDIVTGIVLMQKFERTMEVVEGVRAAVAKMNSDGTAAARRAYRRVLRSRRSRRHHGQHRAAQHVVRCGADIHHTMVVSGRLCVCALIVAGTIPVALLLAVIITVLRGEIRQPSLDRRHRPWHHCRWKRHHGGKHLPPSGAPRRSVIRARATPTRRQSCSAFSLLRLRSTRRSSSPSRSPSRRFCRCSPCRASKARFSGRCRGPMPMR